MPPAWYMCHLPIRSHTRAPFITHVSFAIYPSSFITMEFSLSSFPQSPSCCLLRSVAPSYSFLYYCKPPVSLPLPASFLSQIKDFVHPSLTTFQTRPCSFYKNDITNIFSSGEGLRLSNNMFNVIVRIAEVRSDTLLCCKSLETPPVGGDN